MTITKSSHHDFTETFLKLSNLTLRFLNIKVLSLAQSQSILNPIFYKVTSVLQLAVLLIG